MTITRTRTSRTVTNKTTLGLIVGAAIAMTIGVSAAAQAQYYGSQEAFNRGFANRPGAVEALKRGQAAQDYRFRQRQGQYGRRTQRLFNGQSRQAQVLRERGNRARQARTNARYRHMMDRHGVASSSRVIRARNARTAARAARFARTARYARYATGAGAVAALGGVDPITLGIHAATNPKDFARKAGYYARNPHKGVAQVGRNMVNNTRKIGCGVGNVFKKKRNRSRCR